MKRTVFFMILLFFLNPLCLSAQAKTVGKFSKVEGRVDITSPGASARPVNTGDEVSVGDIIRVKSKSKAEIIFGDGGILRIAQKSRVKIDEYIMGEDRKKGIFNLFRGKIENVVKKSGSFFGFKKKNKHEVHTPTAVCGVRGTDFFSTYQKGISNFVFKEGQGYGYSKNRPDQVMNITTGQAMLVIKPDVLPIVRMATAEEIAQHSADMTIKEEEDRDEEKKKDKRVDEGSDDKKRDDKGKDKEPGDDEEKDQKPVGDEPEDQEPGDDKPRDREPDDQEPGDYESGDDDRGDDKRGDRKEGDRRQSRYARAGDKPGDDWRDDDEPGDDDRGDHRRGDRGPRDGRPDRYGPRDDRRGDDGPDDYGPRDDRRGDYGPRDGRPGDYGPRDGPPPGDYRAGDYGPKDYGPGGPPPSGDYRLWGPPPPGEYWGEGPPPPGDYGPEGPPPPGDYMPWGPPPPGDYGAWGPPPPGEYWGGPDDFYAGDFGPGDYWDGPDDYWDGPDDYWGEPIDDYWGMGPDIAYDIYDYIPGFRVDNISISGDSGANKYDLSMSGIYNWTPPFIYVYEDIKGKLTGNLKTGYFLGFTGCGWNKYGQEVDGIAGFFYIADNNTGGLLIGDVSGSYSTNPNNWNASGSLDWVELSSSGISYPSSVDDITDYARDTSFVSGRGDFYDAGDNDVGDISITMASGIFDSIEETQYWGYLRTKVEGSYSTISGKSMSDFDDWFCQFEQKGLEEPSGTENLRLYMSVDGGTSHYSDGEFEGDVTGGWVDIEHAVTGIAVGELHGGYDPSGASTDFFAASGGVWLETSILMTKLGTEAGRNDLAKLDIPNVQIGKATLSGNGNNMDIALNDVTFLANASDQNPRIWATNNVSGTYSAAPTLGQSIKLTDTTGSHNLAADFTVNTWSGGGNWGGKIDSAAYTTNTLEKTEVAPGTTVNIKFKGAAGGTYTGGNISGTAAGWAK